MSIAEQISSDLSIPASAIEDLSMHTGEHYHSFITGGRRIDAPDPQLKLVQFWIADFIRTETDKLPDYVAAYEDKRSIMANAKQHLGHDHLLVLDLHHFFQSCTESMVHQLFADVELGDGKHAARLDRESIDLLTALSTYEGHLTMGSPSSPFIANRIMLPIDEKIRSALGGGVTYTRYSDDMSISSNRRIDVGKTIADIEHILDLAGFTLNTSKTHCYGKAGKRRVTGLYLTPDGKLSLGTKRKKRLESSLYKYLVTSDGDAATARQLIGQINFCNTVEPAYTCRTLLKYGNYGRASTCSGVMELLTSEANSV